MRVSFEDISVPEWLFRLIGHRSDIFLMRGFSGNHLMVNINWGSIIG